MGCLKTLIRLNTVVKVYYSQCTNSCDSGTKLIVDMSHYCTTSTKYGWCNCKTQCHLLILRNTTVLPNFSYCQIFCHRVISIWCINWQSWQNHISNTLVRTCHIVIYWQVGRICNCFQTRTQICVHSFILQDKHQGAPAIEKSTKQKALCECPTCHQIFLPSYVSFTCIT